MFWRSKSIDFLSKSIIFDDKTCLRSPRIAHVTPYMGCITHITPGGYGKGKMRFLVQKVAILPEKKLQKEILGLLHCVNNRHEIIIVDDFRDPLFSMCEGARWDISFPTEWVQDPLV